LVLEVLLIPAKKELFDTGESAPIRTLGLALQCGCQPLHVTCVNTGEQHTLNHFAFHAARAAYAKFP
jgi:hypothetical protein